MNMEAESLRQFQAGNVAAVREHVAQVMKKRSDRKVVAAKNVADLLEYGYRPSRRGASALLLDVLA